MLSGKSITLLVELFCAAIWLEVDIYVLLDQTWQKFSFMGFNPKRGRKFQARTVFISRIVLITGFYTGFLTWGGGGELAEAVFVAC